VLSKRSSETWSDRSLPPQTIRPLELLEASLDPPDEEWPVFPSMHRGTLYERLREAMADADTATLLERARDLRDELTFR
jgi:hypothetical protein